MQEDSAAAAGAAAGAAPAGVVVDNPMLVCLDGWTQCEHRTAQCARHIHHHRVNSQRIIISFLHPRPLAFQDLDSYIAGYTGHTRVDRLLLIAKHCPSMAVDALK